MEKGKDIVAEFPAGFESLEKLAEELRSILFPIKDGKFFIEAESDHNKVYQSMIAASDRALKEH